MSNRPKLVLMVAPVHRSSGNRVVRESVSLVKAGYHVRALVCCDNIFESEGVVFIPAPAYRNRVQRFLKLIKVIQIALKEKADIYHLHNPDMIPVAFILKTLGKTVIYDTHEDYSKRLMLRSWIPKYLRRPLGFILSTAERYLSYYVNITFLTQERLLPYFSTRARLLRNAPVTSEQKLSKVSVASSGLRGFSTEYRLIYAGGLSRARGLFMMLEVLHDLNASGIYSRLWLIGPEVEQCLSDAKRHPGWQYVDYMGVQSHETVLAHMMCSDVGLAILFDEGDHASARPTKLYEYMACGLAFISSNFPIWQELSNSQGGIWVDPNNKDEIINYLVILYKDSRLRSRFSMQGLEFTKKFNWGEEEKILLSEYEKLLF